MLRIIIMAVLFTAVIIAMFSILEKGDITRRDGTPPISEKVTKELPKV
ncbi:MAG: hypothetical protein ACOYNL_00760 [Rickettsiales bacterium]